MIYSKGTTMLLQSPLINTNDTNINTNIKEDFSATKVLSFKIKAPPPCEKNSILRNTNNGIHSANLGKINSNQHRYISSVPECILDAPDIVDDFYINILDWSIKNRVAIALRSSIYLWNPIDGTIEQLVDINKNDTNDIITSVRFMDDGTHIAIGTSDNDIQLWNIESKKQIRTMKGHSSRISSLAWNTHILTSGSRDTNIFHHDVRIAKHHFDTLIGHDLEVCNVKWNLQGTLLASGSNDNKCLIWDLKNTSKPILSFNDSCAAIKAIDWCPWQDTIVATGGGSADRHIRFYNVSTNTLIRSIDTQSQVCSLIWSKTEKEILSSHGFAQNQISIWRYPSLSKIIDLSGHTSRVLYTASSPDGTTVATASGDETLRFWKVWTSLAEKQARKDLQSQYDQYRFISVTPSSSNTKFIPSSTLQLRLR